MKGEVTKLRAILARVARDVEHKTSEIENPCVQQLMETALASELGLAKRVVKQERISQNKVYNAHDAFEAECITKDKVYKPYEFSVKVGVVVTSKQFRSMWSGLSGQSVRWSYAGDSTQSDRADHRKEVGRSVCGLRVPRSRRVRFVGFHFRSEAQSECDAELRRRQHANHPDEDQDFLRQVLAAVDCLLLAEITKLFFAFLRCRPFA